MTAMETSSSTRGRDLTKRYCRAVAKDGRVCSLYLDHRSEEHVENHSKSRWKDGE